jgi:hypothetical protein
MATDDLPISTPPLPQPRRLVDVLRGLSEKELKTLIQRVYAKIDPAKRIDVPSQLARTLLVLPEVRDPSLLPRPTFELLHRIAEEKGILMVDAVPPAAEPLVQRGIVFEQTSEHGVELILPIAFLLQLRAWPGEDPRGVRALLAQVHPDVAAAIAGHYLGRTATPPLALALEPAWEVLSDSARLSAELEQLAPLERKLLHAIEEVGGEVETEELLELEREPMRLRGATGATPSRRGVGFALERRGFLIPVHPNRHVIPTEIARLVGAERRKDREQQRKRIRERIEREDYVPRRARFAQDPVPLALAMAFAVRESGADVRDGVGTPKSLLSKLSTRLGRSAEDVALVASLSRVVGLWDPSSLSANSPPGAYRVCELGRVLFEAWRRGGAWDESREDGELMRASGEAREAGAVGVVRAIVLEALQELGDGRWAPWGAVAEYLEADTRTPGVARLIERWAQRAGLEVRHPLQIAKRMATETLHVLGVVDLAVPDEQAMAEGPMLRITPRGRSWLSEMPTSAEFDSSQFLDNQLLRVGSAAVVANVLALSTFMEVGSIDGAFDIVLSPRTLSAAIGTGLEPDAIRECLEAVVQVPDPIARQLAQASAVLGRGEFVEAAGFLWVEDPEIRQMLGTRRQTADLFVDPSPPAGLLVAAGVDLDKLARRCRGLGVEIVVEGGVYYTRTVTPPSRGRRSSEVPPSVRGEPPSVGRRPASRRGGRRSAAS